MWLERERIIKRKKKSRWSEYMTKSVPVIYSSGPNREWVQWLKEKINNIEI